MMEERRLIVLSTSKLWGAFDCNKAWYNVCCVISRYMECLIEIHLLATKRILRYLQGTKEFGLFFKKGEKLDLFSIIDNDYAEDSDNWKSTFGYVFMLGTGVVPWSLKKQPVVTLSTTETEFVVITACACQAIWLNKILEELQFKEDGHTLIYCDNSIE